MNTTSNIYLLEDVLSWWKGLSAPRWGSSFATMLFVPLVPAMTRTISREMFDINTVVKYVHLFEKFISGNTVLK